MIASRSVIATMSKRRGVAVAALTLGLLGALLLGRWLAGPAPEGGPAASGRSRDVRRPAPERPPGTDALVARLRRTRLVNGSEVYRKLGLEGDAAASSGAGARPDGFATTSPYGPPSGGVAPLPEPRSGEAPDDASDGAATSFPGRESVRRWYASLPGNTEVCGVRFLPPDRVGYRLQTFPDPESAHAAGYVITHRNHCGVCSSLRDLAVYLAQPDLTSPARSCARRLTAAGVKTCFMEDVGFEEPCAEAWAYNALHTRRVCAATCIGHYGVWAVLTNAISAPNTDGDGNLNPCLACDERASGPGFQYAAGRTRRSSGLTSAIARAEAEIYPVDHTRYFR